MKYSYIFLLVCILYTCQKVDETPLAPGQQLVGTWKVYSYVNNDTIEFISEYRSIIFQFGNFNGRYGTLSEVRTYLSGFEYKLDYFYTVNANGNYLTRYLNEEDISSNFHNGGWDMALKKDSLILSFNGIDDMGNKTSSAIKSVREK